MTSLLPHVREPAGEPDECPLRALVALVNGRIPEGSPYHLDPTRAVGFGRHWGSEHYWVISDGHTTHQWQQAVPLDPPPSAR